MVVYREYTRPTALTLMVVLGNGYRTLAELQELFPEIAVRAYLENMIELEHIRKVVSTTYDFDQDCFKSQTKYTLV